MAYRKAARKSVPRSRSASGGGYRQGAGGGGYRNSGAAAGRAGGGKAAGVHTVRIVIEQPGGSATARVGDAGAGVTPKKSPF